MDRRTDIVITIKTKSEVKVKVTVIQKWYETLRRYKRYAPDMKWDGLTVQLLYASQSSLGGIKMWLRYQRYWLYSVFEGYILLTILSK